MPESESRQPNQSRTLLRSVGSISGLTLVSRVLGLLRDMLTTYVLGVSWASGTFVLAWMLPNLLRRLFGEGALSAAFIPAYAKALKDNDQSGARSLLAGISGALLLFLCGLTALVLIISFLIPPETWGLGGEGIDPGQRGELMSELLAILFPYVIPVCLLAVYAGALNAHGVFAAPAAAPALLNIFWIGGLLLALSQGDGDLAAMTRIIAVCLLVGGGCQLLLVIIPLARRGHLVAPRIPRVQGPECAVLRRMGPAILGLSLVQLNLILDQTLAEYLVSPGASLHIFLANRLLLLPHALVALPIAIAIFPRLATLAADRDLGQVRAELDQAMRMTMFLALPAAAGLIIVAGDFIEVCFRAGAYSAEDVEGTRWTTIALVCGLPGLGAAQLYVRALYALGEVAAPARIAGWLVLLNLGLNLWFVLGLDLGVAGFTAATTCCSYANLFALRHKLAKLCPAQGSPSLWAHLRLGISTLAMAAGVMLIQGANPSEDRMSIALFQLALPVAGGVLIYMLIHLALGSPELEPLKRFIRRSRG